MALKLIPPASGNVRRLGLLKLLVKNLRVTRSVGPQEFGEAWLSAWQESGIAEADMTAQLAYFVYRGLYLSFKAIGYTSLLTKDWSGSGASGFQDVIDRYLHFWPEPVAAEETEEEEEEGGEGEGEEEEGHGKSRKREAAQQAAGSSRKKQKKPRPSPQQSKLRSAGPADDEDKTDDEEAEEEPQSGAKGAGAGPIVRSGTPATQAGAGSGPAGTKAGKSAGSKAGKAATAPKVIDSRGRLALEYVCMLLPLPAYCNPRLIHACMDDSTHHILTCILTMDMHHPTQAAAGTGGGPEAGKAVGPPAPKAQVTQGAELYWNVLSC